jgi:ParB-like chromosome segregation protein Spo0J
MPVKRKENLFKNINDLTAYPTNAKKHPENQIKLLAESIKKTGFIDPVIIDEDDMILAGHGRVLAMDLLQEVSIECVRVIGLTKLEKKAYVIADNKLSELGAWDLEQLRSEAIAIIEEADGFDLTTIGLINYDYLEIAKSLDVNTADLTDTSIPEFKPNLPSDDDDISLMDKKILVIVQVNSLDDQQSLFRELRDRGYKVKI